jgi:uncharacterized protein (TIGR03066 family)
MKPLFAIALGIALFAPAFAAADEPKKDDFAAKILGKWELTKSDDNTAPVGALVTFAKGGKLTVVVTVDGKEMKFEGTWKIEKDQLLTELKVADNAVTDTDTIKKLTDETMEIEGKDKKKTVLTKKK